MRCTGSSIKQVPQSGPHCTTSLIFKPNLNYKTAVIFGRREYIGHKTSILEGYVYV